MVVVVYTETFLRNVRRLPLHVQEQLLVQVERFRLRPNDSRLHTKMLHGRFDGCSSFRVTRNYRVLYRVFDDGTHVLLAMDDRKDIYR